MAGMMPASRGRRRQASRGRSAIVVAVAVAAVIAVAGAAIALTRHSGGGGSAAPGGGGSGAIPKLAQKAPIYPKSSLAPRHGALFGAWVQVPSWAGADPEQRAIKAFEHTIGRKLAVDQLYLNWGQPMPLPVAAWDLRHRSIPMITLSGASASQIAAGAYDTQIRKYADQLKSLHGPVMLRWFAEMTLPDNRKDAQSPDRFIAAWQHMHRIFAQAGAKKVRWVWCPSASAFVTGTAQKYYPGNSYVDWVGADGYNWAPVLKRSPRKSVAQIFSAFYAWGLRTGKPMLVGEYGTVEGATGAKAAWFRQADQQFRTLFPGIKALVYFNSIHAAFGQYFDWRVTSSRSAITAFRAFAQDPYFSARPSI